MLVKSMSDNKNEKRESGTVACFVRVRTMRHQSIDQSVSQSARTPPTQPGRGGTQLESVKSSSLSLEPASIFSGSMHVPRINVFRDHQFVASVFCVLQ